MSARTSNSPASRWRREHGTKIIHRSWWSARLHAYQINRRNRKTGRTDMVHVYACQWGAQYRTGQTAERHWHVGHPAAYDMWGY